MTGFRGQGPDTLPLNQIIYERMHGATAARFDEFKDWKGIEETKFGAHNFRCSDGAILRLGEALLEGRFFDPRGQTSVELLPLRYRSELRAYLALQWKKIRDANASGGSIGIFDAVVMIVDPRQESSKTPLDEQRRLYYVCATRAKRHLTVFFYPNEMGRVLALVLTPPRPPIRV